MKAKLKTNVYGDPDYVAHVLRYYHIGNNNIVEVAKSQVGTTSGSKYWTWYGFNKKVNWCAIFVSWCANESGMLDDSSVPKFSLCTDGENWYKKNNRWKDKSYVPMTGNIIFFDWQQDGHTDHVGIVEKVENGKVTAISEGTTKIIATASDGSTATCTVTVKKSDFIDAMEENQKDVRKMVMDSYRDIKKGKGKDYKEFFAELERRYRNANI